MKNFRKKVNNAIVYLLTAAMLLAAVPETAVLAEGAAETAAAMSETEQPETEQSETEQPQETAGGLSPEEMYEIDGGDAEYWKYYDAEGNRIMSEDIQTYSAPAALSGLTLKSPYNNILYSVLSGYEVSHAIDVSKYNNENSNDRIDWSKVKADGIDSVIVRCGNRGYGSAGTMMTDPYYEKNIKNALAAGLKVGIYIYSQAITNEEAVEEANHCLTLCRNYLDRLDLPIVMDVEYANPGGGALGGRLYNANLTKSKQTEICKAFCKTIEDAGYQAMVYANKSMLTDEMYPSQLTDAGYQVWLARYKSTEAGYSASPYVMWQYSEDGSVSGITGRVDVNFLYKSSQAGEAPKWENASVVNGTQVNLSWTMAPGAEGYEIERSTDETTWSRIKSLDAAAAICCTDTAVAAETEYFYRIRTYYTENGTKKYGSWSDTVSAITGLKTPSLNTVKMVSSKSVKLTWSSVPQAEGYLVYRKESGGTWDMEHPLTTIASPKTASDTVSFTDKSVTAGKTYYYTVKAYHTVDGEVYYSKYNTTGIQVKMIPAASGSVKVTAEGYKTLKFTWGKVTGADGYQVYRKVSGGSWTPVSNDPDSTSYTDTGLDTGTAYYYTVSAYFLNGDQKIEGSRSKSVSGRAVLAVPVMKSASSAGYNSIKITWGKVAGANGYQVYRRVSGGSWSSVPVKDDLTTTSWTDTGLTTGITYDYAVRAYRIVNGKKVLSDRASSISEKAVPATPKLGKVTSVNYRNLKVTWSGVSGASGYRIYRKESGGSWKYLADVKSTARSFTDGYRITAGKKYYYSVRGYRIVNGTRIYGQYDTTGISGKAILSTPSVTLKSTQKGKVKISWNKISGASGYAVYRKTSSGGTWTRIKTITSGSTVSYTTSATSGKTYYYAVRAYRKVGSSNVYSKYSTECKIKVR